MKATRITRPGRGWSVGSAVAAVAVSAFFAAGAVGNAFAPPAIAADYARWGYPGWFPYVTAMCEIATARLLVLRRARLLGVALGSLVMAAAIATTLIAGSPAVRSPRWSYSRRWRSSRR